MPDAEWREEYWEVRIRPELVKLGFTAAQIRKLRPLFQATFDKGGEARSLNTPLGPYGMSNPGGWEP